MKNTHKEATPPCPNCKSANTLLTYQGIAEMLFFCGNCEHSWSTLEPMRKRPKD